MGFSRIRTGRLQVGRVTGAMRPGVVRLETKAPGDSLLHAQQQATVIQVGTAVEKSDGSRLEDVIRARQREDPAGVDIVQTAALLNRQVCSAVRPGRRRRSNNDSRIKIVLNPNM